MILYTVWSGEYSDRGMNGIFSTREFAEAYVEEHNRKDSGEWDKADVIEYELDEKAGNIVRDHWRCCLSFEGHLISQDTGKGLASLHEQGHGNEGTWCGSFRFYGHSLVSAEHALKLAAESRQAHLREQAEINDANRKLCEEANKTLVRR